MQNLIINEVFLVYLAIMWASNFFFLYAAARIIFTPLTERGTVTSADYDKARRNLALLVVLPFFMIWLVATPLLLGAGIEYADVFWTILVGSIFS